MPLDMRVTVTDLLVREALLAVLLGHVKFELARRHPSTQGTCPCRIQVWHLEIVQEIVVVEDNIVRT